jgi:hypothetical protein
MRDVETFEHIPLRFLLQQRNKLMDQIHLLDKPLKRTAKPTARAGPRSWETKQYIYEKPKDDWRSSHSDPRLELEQHQHQDSDFIPSDADHGYGLPAFGIGTMSDLSARDPSASELGTLAGGGGYSKLKDPITEKYEEKMEALQRERSKQAAEASRGRHEISEFAKKRLWYGSGRWNEEWKDGMIWKKNQEKNKR